MLGNASSGAAARRLADAAALTPGGLLRAHRRRLLPLPRALPRAAHLRPPSGRHPRLHSRPLRPGVRLLPAAPCALAVPVAHRAVRGPPRPRPVLRPLESCPSGAPDWDTDEPPPGPPPASPRGSVGGSAPPLLAPEPSRLGRCHRRQRLRPSASFRRSACCAASSRRLAPRRRPTWWGSEARKRLRQRRVSPGAPPLSNPPTRQPDPGPAGGVPQHGPHAAADGARGSLADSRRTAGRAWRRRRPPTSLRSGGGARGGDALAAAGSGRHEPPSHLMRAGFVETRFTVNNTARERARKRRPKLMLNPTAA